MSTLFFLHTGVESTKRDIKNDDAVLMKHSPFERKGEDRNTKKISPTKFPRVPLCASFLLI